MKDDDRPCDRKRWRPLWWLLGFVWLVKDDDRSCDRKKWRWLWWLLGFVWLAWLLRSLVRICRLVRREQVCPGGQTVPPWAYRQPDPLIYSQQYLQSLGLAVTWNNPDIHLELPSAPGVPVDSHLLQPDTTYNVIARAWNGSTTAPAVGLPVHVSFLEFGIHTIRHDVGSTNVDLGVKGSVDCPAFATVQWHTPAIPGHYCLQVELFWADDENPANNMGQHNTDVKPLNSPHATFSFPLRNDVGRTRLLRLEADSYEIPALDPCSNDEGNAKDRSEVRLRRHNRAAWPIPVGWQVLIQPREAHLAPNETVSITVDVTSPDGYSGRQAVNIGAFDGSDIVGGVTLYVEGSG
jgi:hypothetical protein